MNEKYLLRLQEDLRLKNFTQNTCNDYYRFTRRFLEFTGKEAMSITYADIRRFIFHMKDNELKKASTINRQDRYTILSDRNLEILTEYRYGRPRGWLFPSTVRDAPLTPDAVERFVKGHSLDDGISHTFIRQLPGHRSPGSTDVYLQMTSKALMGIRSPFDTFEKAGMEAGIDGR
ncbi:phage integrase N-terminal SAM-like domain-containing protein [Enterocloster clostridioformis]